MADTYEPPETGTSDAAPTVVPAADAADPGRYHTELFLTATKSSPDNTGTFVSRNTPGNIGVCLSGGGSRAFAAGIGQLQALEALQANGSSLLNQTRAIATVSGGGWIGIPFVFLPANVSDSDFLGIYIEPANLTYNGLGNLPVHGIANNITSGFSIPALIIQALLLYSHGVPSSDLWQVLMGHTFLQPYHLFVPGSDHLPTQFFSYNATSLAAIQNINPGLANETADLVAQVTGQQRPYLISLSSLSVNDGTQQDLLAPVHSTPFITGVLATPPGAVDANGCPVGGGAVMSFAFDSDPTASANNLITITQSRQWSLTDALGTSSAAFAQTLIDQMTAWKQSPTRFAAALRLHGPKAVEKIARSPEEANRMHAKLHVAITALPDGPVAASDLHQSLHELTVFQALVPQYHYWSPVNPSIKDQGLHASEFADGGSLENSGVASMLSYTDISNVIAFLNVDTALRRDDQGHVVVDDCLPPLFGYQPYVEGCGYGLYAGATNPSHPVFQYNQVFDSSDFSVLLQELWNASNNATAAAIYAQQLTTVKNSWFNVIGGTTVTVIWVYLNYANNWYNAISDAGVQGVVDTEYVMFNFPHYDTLMTDLTATQINLLSSFSSWMVQNPVNAAVFTALYTDEQQAGGGK